MRLLGSMGRGTGRDGFGVTDLGVTDPEGDFLGVLALPLPVGEGVGRGPNACGCPGGGGGGRIEVDSRRRLMASASALCDSSFPGSGSPLASRPIAAWATMARSCGPRVLRRAAKLGAPGGGVAEKSAAAGRAGPGPGGRGRKGKVPLGGRRG